MSSKQNAIDIKYIEQLQKGDMRAFDMIFDYYRQHIYWVGLSYFSNEEKAKDLVQIVFLEIYQKIGNLREPEKFYAWMNRIAYHKCLSMLRFEMKDSLYYTKNMGDAYCDEAIEDNYSDDAITYIQKEQIKEIIVFEIEKLAPKYRTVCYLRFFEDLSYSEISEITDIPLGTITNFIGRLKPKLKKALKRNGFTSASCLGVVCLPNMSEYFTLFINQKKPLTLEEANAIRHKVAHSNKVSTANKTSKIWQLAAYGCMCAAIILPIVVYGISRNENNNTQSQMKTKAKIQNIAYSDIFTNLPYTIEVKTTNENYDEILLNGSKSLIVDSNGVYEVTLLKDSEVIDTKMITIENIDRDIPQISHHTFVDGILTLFIEDEQSGIDYTNIKFYEDGVDSQRFYVDRLQHTITIEKNLTTSSYFEIPDVAGNVLVAKISFYERYYY